MLLPNAIYLILVKLILLPHDVSLFLISIISLSFLFFFIKFKIKFPLNKYISYKLNFKALFLFLLISATIILIRQLFPCILGKYNQIYRFKDLKTIEYSIFSVSAYIFLIPLSEEIIFRLFGFDPSFLSKRIFFYIFCNILAFLTLHYEQYKYFSSISNFCGMFALGILNYFLCIIFINTNNLVYSVFFHSSFNAWGLFWNINLLRLNFWFSKSSISLDILLLLVLLLFFFIVSYLLNKLIFLKPHISYVKLS